MRGEKNYRGRREGVQRSKEKGGEELKVCMHRLNRPACEHHLMGYLMHSHKGRPLYFVKIKEDFCKDELCSSETYYKTI